MAIPPWEMDGKAVIPPSPTGDGREGSDTPNPRRRRTGRQLNPRGRWTGRQRYPHPLREKDGKAAIPPTPPGDGWEDGNTPTPRKRRIERQGYPPL